MQVSSQLQLLDYSRHHHHEHGAELAEHVAQARRNQLMGEAADAAAAAARAFADARASVPTSRFFPRPNGHVAVASTTV